MLSQFRACYKIIKFTAHIFFDDAFVTNKDLCETQESAPINNFVKILIPAIEKAAREVYKVKMSIAPPTKIETPYGGRLIWILPGNTKLIAHLKDKNKIRHKKRWSQVMYMYYLLGYRIMQTESSPERKKVIAQNTFLLALDGDIDFQPKALHLLIGRMKVDPELGAACGRIHPVGKGPMVWYQVGFFFSSYIQILTSQNFRFSNTLLDTGFKKQPNT